MKYANIKEEELKNNVAQDYFWLYDCKKIIGNVDFCVSMLQSNQDLEQESLLWAEAKKGSSDVYKSLVQLILTIGKARTFDTYLPPAFLGAFDSEKIAFIPYSEIHDIFYLNDFNWNVAPSNYNTKEFKLVYEKVTAHNDFNHKGHKETTKDTNIDELGVISKTIIFNYIEDDIYNKWLDAVKPTIQVDNWENIKKEGIIDGDFYLADLLSRDNETLKKKLFVLLHSTYYEADKHKNKYGFFTSSRIEFTDNQLAHTQFWNRYERPPKEEYWDYIVDHRHLLVPQDIRERKGSFYTPRIWVEKS